MGRLLLAPVDKSSYRATLKSEIDLSDWGDRPSEFPSHARVWGVRTDPQMGDWKRNQRTLDKMTQGDPILFYYNSEYFARGRVGVMCETGYIRDNYWEGGPAINVFTVEEYDEDISIDKKEANSILGYNKNFHPQGLWMVNQKRPIDELLMRAGMKK